jgi:hypothetical protein
MSLDGKTHNQIDHILIEGQWHLSVCDVQSFRATDYDTDCYLMVAKVRERLTMSKQRLHRFCTEMFDLKKLNEVKVKEQYCLEISNRLVVFSFKFEH